MMWKMKAISLSLYVLSIKLRAGLPREVILSVFRQEMIPNRKWSQMWIVNDPAGKLAMALSSFSDPVRFQLT